MMRASKGLELCRGFYGFASSSQLLASVSTKLNIDSRRHVEHQSSSNKNQEQSKVPEIPTSVKSSTLANLKKGKGGRSSFSGIVATVFGASGFMGRYVVNELGKIGSQVIVAHRCDASDVRGLKLMGDLGQILYQPIDLRDEAAIKKAVKYSNVVINLIGRDFETKNFKFNDVHVHGARRIARIAREAGVERLIHMSALNASEKPQRIYLRNGSGFLASKARGEQAVLEEFPSATIFRPADMFGSEDRFFNYYVDWYRRNIYYMPLYKKGEYTVKQPVYVGDVSRAIMKAITDPNAPGKIYDAVGPRRYYLSDMVDWMFGVMRKTPELWGYARGPMDPVTFMKITMSSIFCFYNPKFHWERVEREFVTDKRTAGALDLEDLGISALKTIEEYGPWHLKIFRAYNYYSDELGEFPAPEPPKFHIDEGRTSVYGTSHLDELESRSWKEKLFGKPSSANAAP